MVNAWLAPRVQADGLLRGYSPQPRCVRLERPLKVPESVALKCLAVLCRLRGVAFLGLTRVPIATVMMCLPAPDPGPEPPACPVPPLVSFFGTRPRSPSASSWIPASCRAAGGVAPPHPRPQPGLDGLQRERPRRHAARTARVPGRGPAPPVQSTRGACMLPVLHTAMRPTRAGTRANTLDTTVEAPDRRPLAVTFAGDLDGVSDTDWRTALRSGALKIDGSERVRRELPHWFRPSIFSGRPESRCCPCSQHSSARVS